MLADGTHGPVCTGGIAALRAFSSGDCGFGRPGRIIPSSPRLCPQLKYAYESPVNGFMLPSPPLEKPPPPAVAAEMLAASRPTSTTRPSKGQCLQDTSIPPVATIVPPAGGRRDALSRRRCTFRERGWSQVQKAPSVHDCDAVCGCTINGHPVVRPTVRRQSAFPRDRSRAIDHGETNPTVIGLIVLTSSPIAANANQSALPDTRRHCRPRQPDRTARIAPYVSALRR